MAFDRKSYMERYNKTWHERNGATRNKARAVAKREWYLKNRPRVLEARRVSYLNDPGKVASRVWRKNNPTKVAEAKRRYHLKYEFGITVAMYEEMLAKQNGVCAICSYKQEGSLAVDHCHESGRIRGLLCRKCNIGIGHFRDNIGLLQAAGQYLQESYESSN